MFLGHRVETRSARQRTAPKLRSLGALSHTLLVPVLETKRVQQGRELHISHVHHNPQKPGILANVA